MTNLTKEFERLIIELSHAGACWNLTCTTCGQMVTRGLFRRLDQLPDDLSNLDPSKIPFERNEAPSDSIIDAASRSDMKRLFDEAVYPDWIGLLGVILTENINPESYALLTKRWGETFSQMNAPSFTTRWKENGNTFNWRDLELLEKDFIHPRRPRNPRDKERF